jgi:mannosyltransferase OCH1-like enzyme
MAVFTQHLALPESNLPTIPLNIFQTWHSKVMPPHMNACVESLKRDNPEFKHHLFDDNDCREFIRDKFPPEVLHAYNSLYPGAYKADLWRYCVLYIHGGIYLDIKLGCISPFKLIKLATKERYVRDREYHFNVGVYQACLITYPKNPILYSCIQKIVEYVRTLEYGDNVLFIGPMLMANHFDTSTILSWDMKFNGKDILFGNTPILRVYPEFIKEFIDKSITPYYMEAWAYRKVYTLLSLPSQSTREITHPFSKKITNLQRLGNTLYFHLVEEYVEEDGIYHPSDTPIIMGKVNITDTYEFIGEVEYVYPIRSCTVFFHEHIYHLLTTADTCKLIGPTTVNISSPFKRKMIEPLWAMIPTHELYFVYEWYPLLVIRLVEGVVTPHTVLYDTPRFFKELVAATHMVHFKGQFWCILTKTHHFVFENTFKKFAHVFVVFDNQMKLVKYSEFFIMNHSPVSKISDFKIDSTFTITYTTDHGRCFISEHSYDDIEQMRWTYH